MAAWLGNKIKQRFGDTKDAAGVEFDAATLCRIFDPMGYPGLSSVGS